MVTANIAPMAVTKIIPVSVRPNQRIASGTQATDGIDCSPRTREPIVWLTVSTLAMKIPSTRPPAIAIAKPITSRNKLVPMPKNKLASAIPYAKSSTTSNGDGNMLSGQMSALSRPCHAITINA